MEMTSEEQHETIDKRRSTLINDPNYAIVLSFLEKFRSTLDLPIYSFERLENHLLTVEQRIPPRLIDFHFVLLKRLSLAKNTPREKFDSILTKFVSRFDFDDSEHLTTNGYLQTDVKIKIRILKNLLESQFDLNQTFKNTLIDRSARDLKCSPLGRDRFGVSYWFFMDSDCFVRLFREDVDVDRNWTSVAQNRDELEKFVRLLITDSVVRKKFADWTIDYEPLASLTTSNEFQERFLPTSIDVKIEKDENENENENENEEEETTSEVVAKKKRGRPRGSTKISAENSETIKVEVKTENEELTTKTRRGRRSAVSLKSVEIQIKQNEPIKVKRGRGRPSLKEIKQEREESVSYDDEPAEPTAKKRRGRPSTNTKKVPVEIEETKEEEQEEEQEEEEAPPAPRRGRKRKTPVEESPIEENTSANVRRSSRARKVAPVEFSSAVVSTKSKKKRTTRSTRRRKTTSKRNRDDRFCLSSSSSDECNDYLSDEDDDDEFEHQSEDYLPDPSDFDLVDEQMFDLDDETNSTGEQLRTAKTAQASTIVTTCRICVKSDRPEVLLLCDDCDDAYHIECLRPALLSVPDGDWFCPLCEHKKLSENLIVKLKELFLQYQNVEEKRRERLEKASIERKIRPKEYSSDESVTASESEEEMQTTAATDAFQSQEDESMLSVSQTNENSNLSSSNFEETNKNISQRGRHRRTRFDMTKMLNESDENSASNDEDDDEYTENTPQIANFDLQLPKKMTRLLNYRYRPVQKMEPVSIKHRPIRPRPASQTGLDLNENFDSPLNFVNGDASTNRSIKSMLNNSKQTLKIVRRWNDVQRRSRLKITNTTTSSSSIRNRQETTSDCADENSVFCPDDSSPPRSNESQNNSDLKDDESTIIRSKVTLIQPVSLVPVQKSSNRNLIRKNDATFDRLTRDIQYAVSEANTLSTVSKTNDQQQVNRIQRTNFSPYFNKIAVRPLPVLLPKPATIDYKIFKSKDPPLPSHSTSTTTDLSNIMLTPSSSSSLMDNNDDPTGSTMTS